VGVALVIAPDAQPPCGDRKRALTPPPGNRHTRAQTSSIRGEGRKLKFPLCRKARNFEVRNWEKQEKQEKKSGINRLLCELANKLREKKSPVLESALSRRIYS
jgi:hypothetical protein